jgi:hypothetical protein
VVEVPERIVVDIGLDGKGVERIYIQKMPGAVTRTAIGRPFAIALFHGRHRHKEEV